jgi:hypothetical protein
MLLPSGAAKSPKSIYMVKGFVDDRCLKDLLRNEPSSVDLAL